MMTINRCDLQLATTLNLSAFEESLLLQTQDVHYGSLSFGEEDFIISFESGNKSKR